MYELFRVGTNETVRKIWVSVERGSTVTNPVTTLSASLWLAWFESLKGSYTTPLELSRISRALGKHEEGRPKSFLPARVLHHT